MARASQPAGSWPIPRDRFVFAGLLLCLLALGGASRADALTQGFVRVVAVATIAAVFWNRRPAAFSDGRTLFALLAGWTALMAVQLVPLPPPLWSSLPGRELLTEFYRIVDRPAPWRPLTIQPHLTANSLFAMVVPWAALLLMAIKLRRDEPLVELVLVTFLLASMMIGVLQMASGGRALYFYEITNQGSPVGLFSNRNHNAFVAVLLIPLIARLFLRRDGRAPLSAGALAALGIVAFVVLIDILMIGSRMGAVLFAVTLAATWALLRAHRLPARVGKAARPARIDKRLFAAGAVAIAVVCGAIVFAYRDRFVALTRLSQSGGEEERLAYLPWVLDLIERYLPFGSGFGTFPTVFKIIEPDALLRLSYLNHAHNDVLEIWVEGGILAGALAVLFAGLWLWRTFSAWRPQAGEAADDWRLQARLGSIVSGVLLIGSATDYPLRTPACAAIFVIGCYWLFRRRPVQDIE